MDVKMNGTTLVVLVVLLFLGMGSRRNHVSRRERRMYRVVMRKSFHSSGNDRHAKSWDERRRESRTWFFVFLTLSILVTVAGFHFTVPILRTWGVRVTLAMLFGWWVWWLATRHRERVVIPLFLVLLKYAGWDENDRPSRWLKVPRRAARTGPPEVIQWAMTVGENSQYLPDWVKRLRTAMAPAIAKAFPVGGAEVKLKFPKYWEGSSDQVAKISEILQRRLPGDWSASYNFRKFRAVYSVKKPMPTRVPFEMGENPQPHLIPIGMVSADKWFHVDEAGVAPHGMVSASTGFGKTTVLMIPAAWTLYFGGYVFWCDVKRSRSLMQIKGTPGLRIFMDIESIANAIHEFYISMMAYYDAQSNGEDITDEDRFPSKTLILDELPSTREMLRIWWKKKNGGKRGAGECPAFTELAMILTQGREANHHVWAGVQQASKDVLRSSLERDQYAIKVAAGPQSPESWRMLFGGRRVSVPLIKGRAIFGIGPMKREIQLAYITEAQFREMGDHGEMVRRERSARVTQTSQTAPDAVSGDVPGQRTDAQQSAETGSGVPGQRQDVPVRHLRLVKDETPSDQGKQDESGTTPSDQGQDEPSLIVGIRAGAEFLGMSEAAFKKARDRAIKDGDGIPGETREGRQPAWPPLALREWHAQRPIAGARELPPTASG